jgi:hypothetical protein
MPKSHFHKHCIRYASTCEKSTKKDQNYRDLYFRAVLTAYSFFGDTIVVVCTFLEVRALSAEVGKVTLKSNGDEALNDVSPQKVTAMKRLMLRKNCSHEAMKRLMLHKN